MAHIEAAPDRLETLPTFLSGQGFGKLEYGQLGRSTDRPPLPSRKLSGLAPFTEILDIKPGEPFEDRLGGLMAQSYTVTSQAVKSEHSTWELGDIDWIREHTRLRELAARWSRRKPVREKAIFMPGDRAFE